jgi:alpha-galactosidase
MTPLSTRFNVAAFGVLGYELDLRWVSALEKKEIREQIAFYKKHRETLQFGRFSRVESVKDNTVLWQVVAPDQSKAVAGFFQTLATASEGFDRLSVSGLNPTSSYRMTSRPQFLYLDRFGELLKHVLPLELNPDGVILRNVGKVYKLNDAAEDFEVDGAILAAGVFLNNQFIGTHYNEATRLLSDFGSTLYLIEETP